MPRNHVGLALHCRIHWKIARNLSGYPCLGSQSDLIDAKTRHLRTGEQKTKFQMDLQAREEQQRKREQLKEVNSTLKDGLSMGAPVSSS